MLVVKKKTTKTFGQEQCNKMTHLALQLINAK